MAPLYFGDSSSEALQHRPHQRISFELLAQLFRAGRSARRSRYNCFYFSTHAHRPAQHFARTGTDLFERVASFHHFGEGTLLRRKINSQFRAFQFPAAALVHDFAQKFLLRLERGFDFRNLFLAVIPSARVAVSVSAAVTRSGVTETAAGSSAGEEISCVPRALAPAAAAAKLGVEIRGSGVKDVCGAGEKFRAGCACFSDRQRQD